LGVNDVYAANEDSPHHRRRDADLARSAAKIWSEAELAELVDYVAHNPEAGDVIQGTGGVRKLRWGKAEVASAAARG
jgi:UDP-N-acetylmuramate-alanine ligase